MTTALVIAGHGSQITAQTAAPAWQHADTIRAMGVFDEVTCAFWKESPSLHRVLDTLTADDITIVPLFTSQGYFPSTVLPTELELYGLVTHRNGRVIRYANAIGSHPHMTDVVRNRAQSVVRQYGLDPAKTALAIAGHGTRRDPESAAATAKQVETLRNEGWFAEVVAVYMEEPPQVAGVYDITTSPSIIVVPFFVADGSHTQEDIPIALHLTTNPRMFPYRVPTKVKARQVYYTPAVGMEPSVADVILDLAYEAGASRPTTLTIHDVWTGIPIIGVNELQKMKLPFIFGELLIDQRQSRYILRHVADSEPTVRLETPAALRQYVSFDANGNYRALPTQNNLPHGWYVEVASAKSLLAAINTIYPTAWLDYIQHKKNAMPIQTFEQVVARQTGIYKNVAKVEPDMLRDVVLAHCGKCERHPTWYTNEPFSPKQIPCTEPCQCWMTFAFQQVVSERQKKAEALLSQDELDSLIAALSTASAYTEADVRPNEYDDPRNPARLRMLRQRLLKLKNETTSDDAG